MFIVFWSSSIRFGPFCHFFSFPPISPNISKVFVWSLCPQLCADSVSELHCSKPSFISQYWPQEKLC